MEEILKGIKYLETFENKRQQWDVIKEIDGDNGTISEREIKEREKFEKAKLQLINSIDFTINREDFDQITNEPEIAKIHLYALKGCLTIINFDNITDSKVDIEKYRYSILKDIKNKTLEQEIEVKECEDELKRNTELDENLEQDNEQKYQEDEELYQYKMPVVKKNRINIFVKIKNFFQSKFGKNKRIKKQNMIQREELKYNKQSVAPLLEMENDSEKQIQTNFNNIIQTQKEYDKNQKELDEPQSTLNEQQKEFRKVLKVNGKYAEWKNGNVVIKDDIEKEENNSENIIK